MHFIFPLSEKLFKFTFSLLLALVYLGHLPLLCAFISFESEREGWWIAPRPRHENATTLQDSSSAINCIKITRHSFCSYVNKFILQSYAQTMDDFSFLILNSNKYKTFIQISPIIIVIYDCIINNFIIIHVYYYLLIYTPIMLIKRITTVINNTNFPFTEILWDIYYKKDKREN